MCRCRCENLVSRMGGKREKMVTDGRGKSKTRRKWESTIGELLLESIRLSL